MLILIFTHLGCVYVGFLLAAIISANDKLNGDD